MTLTSLSAGPHRRGLVLGAGGVLGAAWTIGALAALSEAYAWDPREADVLVGTSAGSVLAASLGAGIAVGDLLDHQRGIPVPGIEFDHDAQSALPPFPRPGIGSPRGLVSTARRPFHVTPMMALTTVLPRGRGSIAPVGQLVDAVVPDGGWAPHPRTWVVAMDYDSGRRVTFGRPGAPPAALRDAVMASCSIPGWYAPVRIGSRCYVDGGACSPTSADLVAPLGLDEVVVLSPMTSLEYDRPSSVAARLERRFRRLITRRVLAEVRKVEATGTKVTLLGPGAEDLAAIGANLMDPRRRERVLETSLRTSRAALRAPSLPRAS
ncbi:MAG TPA: patatin-like phospholipase family protein [Mycobacteriales bacterium]|nr:patatin-like phospholipase family protein [Mycobacteriales bacterium]